MAGVVEDHVTLLDWSIALVPVLLMVGLFVWLDVFKLMRLGEILVLLALGGVAAMIAYPISGRVIDTLPLGFSFYSRFVAPWIEESLKGLAVIGLLLANRIGYKLDAVISGFAIGAGFSVVENIVYLLRFPDLATSVWMVRGLGTALMHGAASALFAAILHELAERANRATGRRFGFNPVWAIPGLIVAAVVHTAFNQFPDQPLVAMIAALVAAPIVMMAIFAFGTSEAQAWLAQDSAAHRAALGQVLGGGFPLDQSGRRIAALAARLAPGRQAQLRDYVATELSLVIAAEDKLAGGAIDREQALRLLERRAALRQALGKATIAALDPMLPLSRNDRWEVAELREDVVRGARTRPS